MNHKKLHVILVAQEGFKSMTCGVGMVVANFIDSFPEFLLGLGIDSKDARLSVIGLYRDKLSIGYDPSLDDRTREMCLKTNGKILYIKPQWREKYGYFDIPVWRKYNLEARKLIKRISKSNETTLVIHHDGIFSNLQNLDKNILSIWIPNSLSIVHKQLYSNLDARDKWEKMTVDQILKDHNSFIGCISKRTEKLITQKYKVPQSKLIDTYNGFSSNFFDRYKKDQKSIGVILKKENIPVDKDIILAYGRPDEYKGLTTTLSALAKVARKKNMHVVMIASMFSIEPIVLRIQSELLAIQEKNKDVVTLVTRFEFSLPKYLLQWKRTTMIACLPKRDFAPLIPSEAAVLGHKNLKFLISNIPCFDSSSSLRKSIQTPLSIKSIILKSNQILKDQANSKKALKEYKIELLKHSNIARNYLIGIKALLQNFYKHGVEERSAGVIVFHTFNKITKVLLVKHRNNTYVFPKGHIEPGEDSKEAAIRELEEETGYSNVVVTKYIGTYKRSSRKPDGKIVIKSISMYNAKLVDMTQNREAEEKYAWVKLREAIVKFKYKEDKEFFEKVLNQLI